MDRYLVRDTSAPRYVDLLSHNLWDPAYVMPTIDQTQRSTNLLLACDESSFKLFNDEHVRCLHVADMAPN